MPSARAFAQTCAISDSYCSLEHGQGSGTAQSGSPAAAACHSTRSCRTACMATRSATSLKVVSSPTTSYSARWRRTWRLHALSLPLLHDKRMRFLNLEEVGVFGITLERIGLYVLEIWWTWSGSNRRPLPCHGSALPAAPQAHTSTETKVEEVTAFILAGMQGIVKRRDTLHSLFRSRPSALRMNRRKQFLHFHHFFPQPFLP